jgi:hypothetical protein
MVLSSRSCRGDSGAPWPTTKKRKIGFLVKNEPRGTEGRHEKERVSHRGQRRLVPCAETGGCDDFVTCDDDLVRTVQARRRAPKLRVIASNPVEFIRREGESRG